MIQDPELLTLIARARTVAVARDGARKLLAEIRRQIEARRNAIREETAKQRQADRQAALGSGRAHVAARKAKTIVRIASTAPAERREPRLGPTIVKMARAARAAPAPRFYGDTQPRASR